LIQDNFTQSPRETLNSSQLKLRSSRETLESKVSQNTNNNSKQLRSYNNNNLNKSQDASNLRSIPTKSSQRISGKISQRKYNSNSPKPSRDSYNYSRPSQNSSYSNSQTASKSPQRNPMNSAQFYEDRVSINSKALENPLSVVIPDDDIATLTSFWSMDGPNLNAKDKINTFAS